MPHAVTLGRYTSGYYRRGLGPLIRNGECLLDFLSLRILRRKKLILTLFSEFREKSQNLNINLSHEINSDIYLKTLRGKSLNPDNNFSILRR